MSLFAKPERVVLEQMKVAMAQRVGPHFAEHLTIHRNEDMFFDDMLFRLESYVLAEKLVGDSKTVTFTTYVPASWWQHFKGTYGHQWWLRRFVRRWPVKNSQVTETKTVTFERYATYPQAKYVAPLGKPVTFERFS